MHNKTRLNSSRDLVSVGDNTTDERGVSGIQGLHEVIKLALVEGGHSLAASHLLPATIVLLDFSWLTRVIMEALDKQLVAAILEQLNNSVIERILVLGQPVRQVVVDNTYEL